MKAKLTIIILALGLTFSAKAQYVTIPDANFVAWLQANYPSCMNGNLMDTTCAGIVNDTIVLVNNMNIHDLTGIQYFDNLKFLDCSANFLTYFPNLPLSLNFLDFNINQITSISSFPPLLENIDCSGNLITSLPALPFQLKYFNCYGNQIPNLPTLPSTLLQLECGYNHLVNLPTLPNALNSLQCTFNQLVMLPTLPNTLTICNCRGNQLTNLPELPISLFWLDCEMNLLSNLPSLPNSLQLLLCYDNQISQLPTLPNSLIQLTCSQNQLSDLPALPNTLRIFQCDANNISCLPLLPSSINSFSASGNPLTCLSNYLPCMDTTFLNYPLCVAGDLINNPNGCNEAQGLLGYIYKDNNADCIHNAWDSTKINFPEKIYDSGNNLLGQTSSGLNGVYSFPEPLGTYTVKIDTTGAPFTIQCANPGIDSTVTTTALSPLQSNINFNITCKPGFDLGVQSIYHQGWIFPGVVHYLNVDAGDLSNWYNLHCAAGISGQVVVDITGPVTFSSIPTGALTPTIAGNTFTYNISDFGSINNATAFGLFIQADTTITISDSICVNVSVTPTTGDNNTSNNTFNYCYHVSNSWDPNFKETYPEQVQPGFNDYFYYTVHFQNTGSAAAININLQDTLDANLDLNTFQITNYSHYCTSMLTGNKLSFNFPNIQLPDSTSNFDGSQGYVQYRIKPLANLQGGTMIHNKASIYFDYNPAVVTNTTTNEYMLSIGQSEIRNSKSEITISPNPFTNQTIITIQSPINNRQSTLIITDVLGKQIKTIRFSGKQYILEKGEMDAGIYFISVNSEQGTVNRKIIIQ